MKLIGLLLSLLIFGNSTQKQDPDPQKGNPTSFSETNIYLENLSRAKGLLKGDPLNKYAVAYIVSYYEDNGLTDSVAVFFNDLRNKNPQSPLPYLYETQFSQPITINYTAQINLLEKAIALDPNNQEILLLLGRKYYDIFQREYNRNRKSANLNRFASQSAAYLERISEKSDSLAHLVWAALVQMQHYTGKTQTSKEPPKIRPNDTYYFPPLIFGAATTPDREVQNPLSANWKTRYEIDMFQATDWDEFSQKWYSKHLRAMKEHPLWHNTGQNQVRFLWLRSFDNPIAIRMEKVGDTVTLYWKLTDGAGGYEPGEIVVNKNKTLDIQEWDRYMARLQKAGYHRMSTIDTGITGFDGSQWILEIQVNGQYHIVDRWCGREIKELCLPLLQLTGMELPENGIY